MNVVCPRRSHVGLRVLPTLFFCLSAPCLGTFEVPEPDSSVYFSYATVGGSEVIVTGGSVVEGDVHSNGDLALQGPSRITGDVTVVGALTGQGEVDGQVTEGAPPIELPIVPDEAQLRGMADRVFEGDATFTDEVVDDVVLIVGDLRVRSNLNGTGTILATGDIELDGEGQPGSLELDPETRLSFVALGAIRLGPRRIMRGILRSRGDIRFEPGAELDGVLIAHQQIRLLGGSQVRFEDFDQTPPEITLVNPAADSFVESSTPQIQVEWSDDLSGVDPATATFLLDGVDRSSDVTADENGLAYTPTESLIDGQHTISVSVRDLSDNEASAEFSFAVDTEAPVVTILSPTGTVVGDESPEIMLDYSDAASGVELESLDVLVNGVSILPSCSIDEISAVCESPTLTDGVHSLGVELSDRVGNTATEESSFVIVLDDEPPQIDVTAPGLSVQQDPTPEIVVEYSDSGSGVDLSTLDIRLDGEPILARCAVSADAAICEPPALGEGAHRISAAVRDHVGNPQVTSSFFDLLLDEEPPIVDIVAPVGAEFDENTLPEIVASYSDLASGIDLSTVRVLVDSGEVTSFCTASEFLVGCAIPEPEPGTHAIVVEVSDQVGNQGRSSTIFDILADGQPPALQVAEPDTVVLGDASPRIRLSYSDRGTGIVASSLNVALDGVEVVDQCEVGPQEAICASSPLAAGVHTLTASIEDGRGNLATTSFDFQISLSLEVVITSPTTGLLTNAETIEVFGTVSSSAESVEVHGVEASVPGDGTFRIDEVPLDDGNNTLTVVATNSSGAIGTASVNVSRDATAPQVSILSPPDGFVASNSQIMVTGEYNDPVSSSAAMREATVRVNGVEATVDHRSFFLDSVLLQPGLNRIEVEVIDRAGNRGHSAITVTHPVGSAGARIESLSGNGQSGRVGEVLAKPLVVRLTDPLGTPLVGRLVRFEVSRGTGIVSAGGESSRGVTLQTDEFGQAQATFQLGDRAGSGNHEVTVSSPGVPGSLIFCASAEAAGPVRIVRITGDDSSGAMTGAVGQNYPKPLLSQVFDEFGNPLEGIDVTFEVLVGDGLVNGAIRYTTQSDEQGVAWSVFTLGPEPGVNNQVVVARFPGLEGIGATYTVSGVEVGALEDTSLSGLVLDNQDDPVPGVTLGITGTVLQAVTDAEGRFRIDGAPVGTLHLDVDGSTTTREGTWPHLGFELVTIPGHDNDVGMPIRLLPIDLDSGRIVGGPEDVIVPLRGVPGAYLKVFANSATFPDGSKTGLVSITQVHSDKVPMVAPRGTNFDVAVTVQPPGVKFDPPAQLSVPNVGHELGSVIDIFSFDHDIGEFVTIGSASVTEDGQCLVSNPGFGVRKAGWHGAPPPEVPPTDACEFGKCTMCTPEGLKPTCTDCQKCTGDGCEARTLSGVTAVARGLPAGEEQSLLEDKGRPLDKTSDNMRKLIAGAGQDLEFGARDVLGDCLAEKQEFTWDFGDGNTGNGRTVTHVYEESGTFTARVTLACEGCPDAGDASDEIEIEVVRVDLGLQNLPEESEPEPHEESPGGLIQLNNDDDNQNDKLDLEDPDPVPGDDELVNLRLDIESTLGEGEVELDASAGLEKFKVWEDRAKSKEIELPKTWDLSQERAPGVVYLEGIELSTALGDVVLTLRYENDRDGRVEDRVHATVTQVDLDVDSDNDDGFDRPQGTNAEDAAEDSLNDPTRPGKYLVVNDDDDDKDTITDFADGFTLYNESNYDRNADEKFVPILLRLPDEIDIDKANVRLKYTASDPSSAQAVRVPQNPVSVRVNDYEKGDGELRIWKKKGNEARNKASVASGGDYLEPGVFKATQLGFSNSVREKAFYLEAIQRSLNLGDHRVVVEVDPDGDDGPIPFVLRDAVRLTSIRLLVRDEAASGREIEGGDMAFIKGSPTPEMPRLKLAVQPNLQDGAVVDCTAQFMFDRSPGDNVNGMPDEVKLPHDELAIYFTQGNEYALEQEYAKLPDDRKFFGGDGHVFCRGGAWETKHEFRIRGKNPDDDDARKYIDAHAGFELAYAMSKHESTVPGFVGEYYQQFDLRDAALYEPLLGPPDGWGLFQHDLTRDRDLTPNKFLEILELWNWHVAVNEIKALIDAKEAEAYDWLNSLEARTEVVPAPTPSNPNANKVVCETDSSGRTFPHGQRPQSGIAVNGGVWGPQPPNCDPGDGHWVVAPSPLSVPIPDHATGNCRFSETGGDYPFEAAVTLQCFNGCGRHYVQWGGGGWVFRPNTNDYVAKVCAKVEP